MLCLWVWVCLGLCMTPFSSINTMIRSSPAYSKKNRYGNLKVYDFGLSALSQQIKVMTS